jgi:hypothetical protein
MNEAMEKTRHVVTTPATRSIFCVSLGSRAMAAPTLSVVDGALVKQNLAFRMEML